MNNYKRIVATGLGLSIMLVFGALNALIMNYSDWLTELVRPEVSPSIYSALWLVDYLIRAVLFGEFFISGKLRKGLIPIGIIQVLNAIWCLVFFRLHNPTIPLFIMIIIFVLCVYVVVLCVKNTGIFIIFPTIILLWYAYLLGTNIVITVFN